MKIFKKSVTAAIKNMHGKVDESNPTTGYLYLSKHGVGPGMLPKDVMVLKVMDLPNNWTAMWLDSVLTADELKQYDIPSETEVQSRLGDLGYKVVNNDILPVDEIEGCGQVMAATDADPYSNRVSFFYNRKLIGSCDADSGVDCPEFLDLMKNDKQVATGVLNYLNSLGDPVFPISEEQWNVAETDVDNVDIEELYNTLMLEIYYTYSDWNEVYIDAIPNVEIFTGVTTSDPEYQKGV